jgi:putative transposase
MILVEKHIIKQSHPFYNECDDLCFKSKNLYNQGLYNVRQHFFNEETYLTYSKNYHITKHQESYSALPAKVSNQTLQMVDNNFKSFFNLLKLKREGGYTETINIPKYLDKEGRYIVKYEKQALYGLVFKKTGNIKLSQTNIEMQTKIKDFESIKEVRIVPKGNHYTIEIVYEKIEKPAVESSLVASIDIGLNNLATITFNDGRTPLILNGKPLKSINQYYNKVKTELQSIAETLNKRKTTKRIQSLTYKRNNKVSDYLHKQSRILVNHLVSEQVATLVIGKNKGQKQDSNMGKVNNQNYTQIPHSLFINMLKYKCELEGIKVILQEESYTSKASFLNLDDIPVYGNEPESFEFSGYRKSRGMYKLKGSDSVINADVNGSYNILRKALPKAFANGIEGFAVNPVKLKV